MPALPRAPLPFAALVIITAITAAPVQAAPRIDPTYPPAQDVRSPDRTIDLAGGAAEVIAYSTSGRTLATAGKDGVIRVWNARTGEQGDGALEKSLQGHGGRVLALAFAAEDKLISVGEDRTVKTWDVATGKLLTSTPMTDPVSHPVIQPVPQPPGAARPASQPVGQPPGAGRPASQPGVPPLTGAAAGPAREAEKDRVIAGVIGDSVQLWSSETGKATRSFGPVPKVVALAFTPDGNVLAAASGRTIRLWSAHSGSVLRTVDAGKAVRSLALSAAHLLAGTADGRVKLWGLEGDDSGSVHPPGDPPPVAAARSWRAAGGAIAAVVFNAKGDQMASASGRTVTVWDVASGTRLCTQEGHASAVMAVAFNPNGQKMASAAGDRTARLWTVPLPPLPAVDLAKIAAAVPARAAVAPKKRRRVLVFWRADAILHKGGVPAVNQAIELLGKKTGAFETDFSRDYAALDPRVLARYDALVLNSTAHLTIPDEAKKKALLDYAKGGGGIVGIHAAIDMFKGWPEGAEVVGATFGGHPWNPSGTWAVKLDDPGHPLLRAWGGKGFKMRDEFYELAEPYRRSDRHVLMSLDVADAATATVKPLHRTDRDFAVSWIKNYGQGRVFYAMFGHIADSLWDPRVLAFYLDGIQYALGDLTISPPVQN